VTRWLDETGGTSGDSYDERFRALEAAGEWVHGEADAVEGLLQGSSVLDAGCGTGRVAIELARRGIEVVGVDSDPSMLEVARTQAPHLEWHLADLAELDLGRTFDLVVCAGNVVAFLAPGTGPAVAQHLAQHLRPGGLLVSGWGTARLSPAEYGVWAAGAGLEPVREQQTWDGAPGDGAWCVALHRRP
jgi:SAM-dependent methyltransferase